MEKNGCPTLAKILIPDMKPRMTVPPDFLPQVSFRIRRYIFVQYVIVIDSTGPRGVESRLLIRLEETMFSTVHISDPDPRTTIFHRNYICN